MAISIPQAPPFSKKSLWTFWGLVILVRISITFLPSCEVDMGGYQNWSLYLANHINQGFASFYPDNHVVYAPFYMYFLLVTGIIAKFILGVQAWPEVPDFLVKMWAVGSDLIGALLIRQIGNHIGKARLADILAIGYLLNPAIFFNSSIWGQFDSMPATFLLATLYAFMRNRPVLAMLLFTIACLTKPQSGLLLPVVSVCYFRLLLTGENIYSVSKWKTLTLTALVCAAAYTVIVLPFYHHYTFYYNQKISDPSIRENLLSVLAKPENLKGLSSEERETMQTSRQVLSESGTQIQDIVQRMDGFKAPAAGLIIKGLNNTQGVKEAFSTDIFTETRVVTIDFALWVINHYRLSVDDYPYASANSFNFWTLVGRQTVLDSEPFLGIASAKFGLIVTLIGVLGIVPFGILTNSRSAFTLHFGSYLCLAWTFMFATRMHERYLLPAIIFLTVSIFWDRKQWITLVLISSGSLANVWYVYERLKPDGGGAWYPNWQWFPAISFSLLTLLAILYSAGHLAIIGIKRLKQALPESYSS